VKKLTRAFLSCNSGTTKPHKSRHQKKEWGEKGDSQQQEKRGKIKGNNYAPFGLGGKVEKKKNLGSYSKGGDKFPSKRAREVWGWDWGN